MKISDLVWINITSRSAGVNPILEDFIDEVSRENKNDQLLTPKQIYKLVNKLGLFIYEEEPFYEPWDAPNLIIEKLRGLVVREISPALTVKTKHGSGKLGIDNAVLALTSAQKQGILTEENFIALLGTGNPNMISAIDIFSQLSKIGFLDDWSRKIIVDVYSKIDAEGAHGIFHAILHLIRYKHLDKEMFKTLLCNPYKKWHGFQGMAINFLIDLNLDIYLSCKNYLLRDAEHAGQISQLIIDLYLNQPKQWAQIKKILTNNPNESFKILSEFHEKLKNQIKNNMRIRKPKLSEEEIEQQCSAALLISSSEKKPITDLLSTRKFQMFVPSIASSPENKDMDIPLGGQVRLTAFL